mmetsp:Transcript_35003/g.88181  ORF Transcript_35003/g.88181 Transcript_35003/m.88181 type:complete len:488 (+) Transcript_35003:80-1543(+)
MLVVPDPIVCSASADLDAVAAASSNGRVAVCVGVLRRKLDMPSEWCLETGVAGPRQASVEDGPVAADAPLSRIGVGSPCSPNDRFHLGSASKSITAVLVSKMTESFEGLSLDSTVTSVLSGSDPNLLKEIDPAYHDVTLRELLTHSAGLGPTVGHGPPATASWTQSIEACKAAPMDTYNVGRESAVVEQSSTSLRRSYLAAALATGAEGNENPGAGRGTFQYSNTGYTLAAFLVESITGRSYEELVFTELLTPLGVAAEFGIGPPGWEGASQEERLAYPWPHTVTLLEEKAKAESEDDKPVENTVPQLPPTLDGCEGAPPVAYTRQDPASCASDNPPSITPAGRLHATIRGWAGFLRVFLDFEGCAGPALGLTKDTWDSLRTKTVKPESGEDLIAPDTSYTVGGMIRCLRPAWVKAGAVEGETLSHSGSNTMNACQCWLGNLASPSGGEFALLTLTNVGGLGRLETAAVKLIDAAKIAEIGAATKGE